MMSPDPLPRGRGNPATMQAARTATNNSSSGWGEKGMRTMELSVYSDGEVKVIEVEGDTDSVLPDLSEDGWENKADACWNHSSAMGGAVWRFQLDGEDYLYVSTDDDDLYAWISDSDSPEDEIMWWNPGEITLAEWAAEWGIPGLKYLESVDMDDDDLQEDMQVRIWVKPCYFGGKNAPRNMEYYYRDDDGRTEFPLSEARKILDDYYNGESAYPGFSPCQLVSDGQAGPDRMTIVES